MKKKVLVVLDTLHLWGIELAALHFQEGMDPELYDYTYLIRLKNSGPMEARIRATGAKLLFQPEETRGGAKSLKYMTELFKKEKFDVVHAHSTFFNGITMLAAKRAGVSKRISHAHMTYEKLPFSVKSIITLLKRIFMRKLILSSATDFLSCGQMAGVQQYGAKVFANKGMILDNPVDCKRFAFDMGLRVAARNNLGLADDEILIGHVGRFNPIKNQPYLIQMFAKWHEIRPNMKLLMVGDGGYIRQSMALVEQLGMRNQVIFTGNIKDVSPFMMAMDALVFPSVKESFPISLIEAQVAKLPCVISTGVPEEVKMNDNVVFVELSETPEAWLEKLDEVMATERASVHNEKILERFDTSQICAKLAKLYC